LVDRIFLAMAAVSTIHYETIAPIDLVLTEHTTYEPHTRHHIRLHGLGSSGT
jgi:hypothetical protein